MKAAESPIFVKTHDLLVWMAPLLTGFPKDQRFRLAARLENCLFGFQELLLRAARTADKKISLGEADLGLAKDIQCISMGQYEHSARQVTEIGKLLGGWRKTILANPGAAAAERGDQP
jgi:hypothetical protein